MPNRELNKFDFNCKEDYTISVIHHGPEWFSDNVKKILYNKINESTDLLFVGHEHFSLNEHKYVNGQHLDIASGLALWGTDTEKGFNVLLLNTDSRKLEGYKYIYNGHIYKPQKTIDNSNVTFNTKYKFSFSDEFERYINSDLNEREGKKYLDYFVFPSLEAKDINSDMKNYTVTNEEKLIELMKLKNKISIEGGSKSGKTILSKYICKFLLHDYVPLYINTESFITNDIDKVFKYAFLNQYGSKSDIDEFLQLDTYIKVLIVDGYDNVKKEIWNEFVKKYSNEFGYIILFSNTEWNLNIKKRTIEELTENQFFYLRISPFYYIKREQLINKICNQYKEEYQISNIEEKSKKINEDITNQIRYFQLTPDFIYQFVEYYLSFAHIKTQKETNVFSKVFEANITFRISKNTRSENDIDEILVALDFVAHYIHFNKLYPLSYDGFVAAIQEYKIKYDNGQLKEKYVYDVAIAANILREVSDEFEVEFCDENLLAYFVAQHLNRSCNAGENSDDLKYVLDNICFGINGDIILFLSYITSNTRILTPILQSIVEHMETWEELDIDHENIKYLSKVTTQVRTSLPGAKEKRQLKEDKNKLEKQIKEEKKLDKESLYSYDETKVNSFSNKISKSINYLELVAKILPNFRHILSKQQKQDIITVLYAYPNKLLYFMLKDIDINHDKIIKEILNNNPRTKKGQLITGDMIHKELQNQSIGYILSIYDFISTTASTEKTIYDLEKFSYSQNTNYKIQNIMMQENVGNFKLFSQRVEELYDDTDINIVKQMLKLIVRKYFIYHEVEMHGDTIRLIDKFFGEAERKNVQLLQAKNQIIKK